jgi:Ca2+-binding EF-hand superfamily protein
MDQSVHPPRKTGKKSEMIEVRISHETKRDFLAACRKAGQSASDVVRDAIAAFIRERERLDAPQERKPFVTLIPQPIRKRRLLLGAAAVAIAALGLAPGFAQADMRTVFGSLDANHDGVLSAEELSGQRASAGVTVEKRSTTDFDGLSPSGPPKVTDDSVAFWLPDEIEIGGRPGARLQLMRHRKVVWEGSSSDDVVPDDIRKGVFGGFDADADDRISYAEFGARHTAMLTRGFAVLDSNGDKVLSPDEYALVVDPPLPKAHGVAAGASPKQVVAPPKLSPETIKAAFALLDTDKDGRLTLSEYLPPT